MLGHPAVKTVIPGANSADQVRTNLALLDKTIPPAFWSDLKEQGMIRSDAPTNF